MKERQFSSLSWSEQCRWRRPKLLLSSDAWDWTVKAWFSNSWTFLFASTHCVVILSRIAGSIGSETVLRALKEKFSVYAPIGSVCATEQMQSDLSWRPLHGTTTDIYAQVQQRIFWREIDYGAQETSGQIPLCFFSFHMRARYGCIANFPFNIFSSFIFN